MLYQEFKTFSCYTLECFILDKASKFHKNNAFSAIASKQHFLRNFNRSVLNYYANTEPAITKLESLSLLIKLIEHRHLSVETEISV